MHIAKNHPGEQFNTIQYELHPNFVNNSMFDDFDLSIVAVDRPIHFSHNIKPICLPQFDSEYAGEKATVAGW